MDVTSMLNTSTVAAEQSPKGVEENLKIPLRSRTPWDAGGYSLPINTRSIPFSEPNPYHESPTKSPNESSHRPSDSYSSMSSFASSIHSAQHSRFSSTSTVSGFHPLSSITTDESVTERKNERCASRSLRSPLSAVSPSTITLIRNFSSSPGQPLETLAQIAEKQHIDNAQTESIRYPRRGSEMIPSRPHLRVEARTKSVSAVQIARPSSPSDAILIKRTTHHMDPNLRDLSENPITPPEQAEVLKVPGQSPSRLEVQTRGHKRAVSAPDFPGMAAELIRRGSRPNASVGPNAEPTPPSSQHPDYASPGASMLYTAPNTPPETSGAVQEEEGEHEVPRCMYIADCDTGSQPRKAVSHIFGRNKMCTRLIPKMVWVYYCRKHYQRTRYRNAKEYVKLQYDLVAQQIQRLQDWSQENIRKGQGSVVKDWSIAVRKREQKRLDDQKARGGFDQDDSGDDEPRGNGTVAITTTTATATATAVPQWLLDQCGRGYSTSKLMEIVNRLGAELMNGTVSVFPDIEILPNIIVDQDSAEEPKGYAKRKSTSSHQRSQSMGAGLRSDNYPRSRSMSRQPSMEWGPNTSYNHAPILQKKRKRFDDNETDYGSPTSQTQRLRVAEYPMDVGRRGPFGHRSTISNINEHRAYEGEPIHSAMDDRFYQHSSGAQVSPLPAPTPQRYPPQSMAVRLESYGQSRDELRRPTHKRSQSDMGALYNTHPAYRYPSRYEEDRGQHLLQQQYYDEPPPAPRRYYSPPGFYTNSRLHSHPMVAQRSLPHGGHMRHQSTPLLARSFAQHEESSRFHHSQPTALPPPPQLIEAPSNIFYAERRS